MEKQDPQMTKKFGSKNEQGAALIMVLLISFLLMVAATALILEASTNTGNVTDATAEQQAYYAAESGIQSAVNVLRGNVVPNPLINPAPSPSPFDNKIDYRKAVKIVTSNATVPALCPAPPAVSPPDCTPRLSRWMSYNANGVVPLATNSGMSYKVEVSDPDNVGDIVRYNVTGRIDCPPPNCVSAGAYNTWTDLSNPLSPKTVTIRYIPPPTTTVNVSTGLSPVTNFGNFEITVAPLVGGTVPGPSSLTPSVPRVRFVINVEMIQPYNTVKSIRGYIDPGAINLNSPGSVRLFYDSQVYLVQSSLLSLTAPTGVQCDALGNGSPGCGVGRDDIFLDFPNERYYRSGYSVIPHPPTSSSDPGVTPITGTLTAPEPIRLLIKSTGYGPKGAEKQLEAVIQKNYFNGLSAPSPLTLVGPPCTPVLTCTPAPWSPPSFYFQPGNSNAATYTGKDALLRAFLPPVGVTNNPNLVRVRTQTIGSNVDVYGSPTDISDELPFWLQTPRNLDAAIQQLREVAQASGRYYSPTSTTNNNMPFGSYATGTGITFVDKDLEIRGDGGGILVVTGKLTFDGQFNFKGLVVVVGAGGFVRNGGGTGNLQGTMVVAPYNAASLTCTPQGVNCFLAPRYDLSGGGNSLMEYNNNVVSGLTGLSNFVKGVAEK